MAKRPFEPWIERVLKAWSDWVCTTARWQGVGAGVDNIGLIADAGWGRSRNPGTHSDPVLAEVMAALHDGQGRSMRVHAEVMGLPATERQVLVARYCGRPQAVPRAGTDEDTLRVEVDVPLPEPASPKDRVKVKHRLRALQRMANPAHPNVCWIDWQWSGGPLPFTQISQLLGLAPSTCHEALEKAKLRLMFRLEVRDAIRFGRFAPDGGSLRKEEVPDAA